MAALRAQAEWELWEENVQLVLGARDEIIAKERRAGAGRGGRKRSGVRGAHLSPLGLFLRTSAPFIWRVLSAFPPA